MALALILSATVAGWFAVRWTSRGKPYPVWLSGLLDNPVTDRLSGTANVIDPATENTKARLALG